MKAYNGFYFDILCAVAAIGGLWLAVFGWLVGLKVAM